MKSNLRAGLVLVAAIVALSSCADILGGFDYNGKGGAAATGGSSSSSTSTSTSSSSSSSSTGSTSSSSTSSSGTGGTGTGGTGTGGTSTCMACAMASTCPSPTSQCKVAICDANHCCGESDLQSDTPCSTGTGQRCDGHGNCVGCVFATDCTPPTTKCQTATCSAQTCGTSNVASGMSCNDSGGMLCNASGACVACLAATDCQPTGTMCKTPACSGGACTPTLATSGASCSDAGGKVCDGSGKCVACVQTLDCTATGTLCATVACTGNACVVTNTAMGDACSDNGGTVCDGAGKCVSAACTDGSATDDGKTDVNCGGPNCTACANGKKCLLPRDCQSGDCNGSMLCAPCATDNQCQTHQYCDTTNNGGTCTATKANASACTGADQCTSGFCANGVCCNVACNGTCQACTAALTNGSDGTCGNYIGGTPAPSGQCTVNMPCGNDGKCAAGGTCEQASTATPCGSVSCSGSTLTPAGFCSGTGTCAAATGAPCVGGYVCASATTCKTSCVVDTDCIAGDYCHGTTCAPRAANGTSCTAADQCTSGVCANGVCCNMTCNGTCQGCTNALTGSPDGTCANYKPGTAAPVGQCGAVLPCGNDGKCAAGGACEQTMSGTPCGTSCFNGQLTSETCNGGGSCTASSVSACPGNLECGSTTTCLAGCGAMDINCAPGFWCSASTCKPQGTPASGATCTANDQCTNGLCVDGYCCNNACAGTCSSCALSGSQGICTTVPNNSNNPDHACSSGFECCGGSCTNVDTLTNCGSCGTACATSTTLCKTPVCTAGACGFSDQPLGFGCSDSGGKVCNASGSCVQCNGSGDCAGVGATPACCGNACADLSSSSLNCGSCGHSCLGGACMGGVCQPITLTTWSQGFATGYGIAVDATNVYWTIAASSNAGTVNKIPLSGGVATTLVGGLGSAYALAINATTVFFTTAGSPGNIGSCAIAGCGGVPTYLSTTETFPESIAVDPVKGIVYWGNYAKPGSTVRYCPIGGCGGTPTTFASGFNNTSSITVDANHVYWTNLADNTVDNSGLVGMAGSGTVSALASGVGSPAGISVDKNNVYFVTNGSGGAVVSVPILFGPTTTIFSSAGSNFAYTVSDGQYVYWTTSGIANGSVSKCLLPTCAGGPTVLASPLAFPEAITADSVAVYWVQNSSLMKVAK